MGAGRQGHCAFVWKDSGSEVLSKHTLQTGEAAEQVLLVAWKMGAQRMGFFSRDEFLRGLHLLGAGTPDKLRKALPKLEEEVDADPEAFGSFFTFAFKYCCTVRALPSAHICSSC